MNALVLAVLLWLGFSQRLLPFTSSGSVRSHIGRDMDRQRRSLDERDLRCGSVAAFLRGKGLPEKSTSSDQQEEPLGPTVVDAELKICVTKDFERRHLCCTSETEHQLQVLSFTDLRQVLSSSMTPVRHDFGLAINSFSEEFRVILRAFGNSTFHILTNTFRIPAASVQVLLENLISRLVVTTPGEPGHHVQLIRKVVGEFYDELFIAAVHNLLKFNVSADSSDESKLCLRQLRTDTTLLPFGGYPSLFEQHLRRSLDAALTFAWGLQIISDYLNVTVNLDLAEKCLPSVTRLVYCPLCQGLTNTDPCPEKCVRILRACLQSLLGVSHSIRTFADDVIDSVQADLSAVTIFDAILPSMVSESLLKVIETGHMYRNQIGKKCGFRKSTGNGSLSSSAIPLNVIKTLRDGERLRQSLERLRSILLQMSDLLVALPTTFCSSRMASSTAAHTQCWNGTSLEPQNNAVEESRESEESSKDIELTSYTGTANQLDQITSMLQQTHHKTHSLKTQAKEDALTGVQMTSGKTQRPPRILPVKYSEAAATDDEDEVDNAEENDDQYSGGESGQMTFADTSPPRMKTVELTSIRPATHNPPSVASHFMRPQSSVTLLIGFIAVVPYTCIAYIL